MELILRSFVRFRIKIFLSLWNLEILVCVIALHKHNYLYTVKAYMGGKSLIITNFNVCKSHFCSWRKIIPHIFRLSRRTPNFIVFLCNYSLNLIEGFGDLSITLSITNRKN